jgi:hypothetical protein
MQMVGIIGEGIQVIVEDKSEVRTGKEGVGAAPQKPGDTLGGLGVGGGAWGGEGGGREGAAEEEGRGGNERS